MKVNSIIFVIGFLAAFAGGYFFYTAGDSTTSNNDIEQTADKKGSAQEKSTPKGKNEEAKKTEKESASVPAEAEPLSSNNCLSCHAVESLGAKGGTTGPDLSKAYEEVKAKRGKSLEDFLQEPTSAVMSTVIGDNPLKDEEREKIVEALKKAAEK
ncbi:cytochrome C [Virgibacillus dakarensis]|nr:cytochrome C [Virgibacillus dakarensis]